jgi:hypothetical protein
MLETTKACRPSDAVAPYIKDRQKIQHRHLAKDIHVEFQPDCECKLCKLERKKHLADLIRRADRNEPLFEVRRR